jgi:hypothetical protein
MNWFMERRLDWIEDRLVRERRINRADVRAYFGVTLAIATKDVATYSAQSGCVVYDKSEKAFVPAKGFMPVRHSEAARRNAWLIWDPARDRSLDRCQCPECMTADANERWGDAWQFKMDFATGLPAIAVPIANQPWCPDADEHVDGVQCPECER